MNLTRKYSLDRKVVSLRMYSMKVGMGRKLSTLFLLMVCVVDLNVQAIDL